MKFGIFIFCSLCVLLFTSCKGTSTELSTTIKASVSKSTVLSTSDKTKIETLKTSTANNQKQSSVKNKLEISTKIEKEKTINDKDPNSVIEDYFGLNDLGSYQIISYIHKSIPDLAPNKKEWIYFDYFAVKYKIDNKLVKKFQAEGIYDYSEKTNRLSYYLKSINDNYNLKVKSKNVLSVFLKFKTLKQEYDNGRGNVSTSSQLFVFTTLEQGDYYLYICAK